VDSEELVKTVDKIYAHGDINREITWGKFEGKQRVNGEPNLFPGEYFGQVLNGKRDGYGILLCTDDKGRAHFYAFKWKEDYPINQGTLIISGKHFFKYKIFLDKSFLQTGQGSLVVEADREYLGEWKKGKFHGNGKLTWKDGSSYEGAWKEGLKHGHGIETDASGMCCEG